MNAISALVKAVSVKSVEAAKRMLYRPEGGRDQSHTVVDLGKVRRVALMVTPMPTGDVIDQAWEAVSTIREVLKQQATAMTVASQTVFLRRAEDAERCRKLFQAYFGERMPATNFIAQPPCGGQALAIEAWAIGGEQVDVQFPQPDVVSVAYDGLRWVQDKTYGLLTHHADSHLVASVPASGCFLRLSDAQGNGGQDFVYRLYLRAPEPDFELRVTPATIIARAGAVTPITVYALRNDNFAEDIELALVDPPPGFHWSGGIIPGQADRVQMTLTVPSTPPEGPVVLEMAGRARQGNSRNWVMRSAVPAENMMQAFIWYHLVPVEDWSVIVSGRPGPKPPFEILIAAPRVTLPLGKEIILPVRPLSKNINEKELRVALDDLEGVSAEIVTDDWGRFAVKLSTDAEKVVPGLCGNLLLHAYQETIPAPTQSNPNPQPQHTDYGYFPAIPYEISARTR